ADFDGDQMAVHLPLTDEAGNGIGLITFHRKLAANALTMDLKHLCGEFQVELSAALLRVSDEQIKLAAE
ncbi:MAG: hypothetical protein AAB401_16295, partial [Acidobacteriota bacterium]